ncbi:MAG: tRNA pseudouridine(55) synthase TruB [Pseudomonadota bacterium]
MGRRRKSGRPVSGWVLIDKPAGLSSAGVVNKVRWAFNAQKAGHAGTLDPDATGLLVIALGEATKTLGHITDDQKSYCFEMKFGSATTTDDASGEVIASSDVVPSQVDLEAALPQFTGDILQVPPQMSAVKVDGQRAYDLARAGETLDLEARPLFVEKLELLKANMPNAELELVCGKGGYVRGIARDLGTTLGSFAHVVWLRRLTSGPFDVAEAISLSQIEEQARTPELDAHILPVEAGLKRLACVSVTETGAAKLRNGNPCEAATWAAGDVSFGDTVWAAHAGKALAIGTYRAGHFHPKRVLL